MKTMYTKFVIPQDIQKVMLCVSEFIGRLLYTGSYSAILIKSELSPKISIICYNHNKRGILT